MLLRKWPAHSLRRRARASERVDFRENVRLPESVIMKFPSLLLPAASTLMIVINAQNSRHAHANSREAEGLGRVHMDIACSPVVADFDRALALLHNFWYLRALERFNQVPKNDPGCAVAYWGAAMTYNHPFWDPQSQADKKSAWTLVQKGLSAPEASGRERL